MNICDTVTLKDGTQHVLAVGDVFRRSEQLYITAVANHSQAVHLFVVLTGYSLVALDRSEDIAVAIREGEYLGNLGASLFTLRERLTEL